MIRVTREFKSDFTGVQKLCSLLVKSIRIRRSRECRTLQDDSSWTDKGDCRKSYRDWKCFMVARTSLSRGNLSHPAVSR